MQSRSDWWLAQQFVYWCYNKIQCKPKISKTMSASLILQTNLLYYFHYFFLHCWMTTFSRGQLPGGSPQGKSCLSQWYICKESDWFCSQRPNWWLAGCSLADWVTNWVANWPADCSYCSLQHRSQSILCFLPSLWYGNHAETLWKLSHAWLEVIKIFLK